MDWHRKFKEMKSELGLTNSDIAEIIGNSADSVKSVTQPKKDIPRWLKLGIVIHKRMAKNNASRERQLKEDIKFLSERQLKSDSISHSGKRETGISSNSIVSIAYGLIPLEEQEFPNDLADMNACENMWYNLPDHRKEGDALKAMKAARKCNYTR